MYSSQKIKQHRERMKENNRVFSFTFVKHDLCHMIMWTVYFKNIHKNNFSTCFSNNFRWLFEKKWNHLLKIKLVRKSINTNVKVTPLILLKCHYFINFFLPELIKLKKNVRLTEKKKRQRREWERTPSTHFNHQIVSGKNGSGHSNGNHVFFQLFKGAQDI